MFTNFIPNSDIASERRLGEQSMKWLALVASQRLFLKKPEGKVRFREDSHAMRGFFMPEEISTKDGGITNPNSKICDVLEDGGLVTVKVSKLGVKHHSFILHIHIDAFFLCFS